uniref:Uncharacterized protein n=1 Tax=Romanomermis culicivorax TaxID=13658 RepID=A0A915JI54_ROMCU
MFLMTYRSFCEPRELLNLLLERFFIPDPNFGDFVQNYNQQQQQLQWDRISCSTEISNFSSMTTATENGASTSDFDPFLRDVMKKFRKDYAQPIQIRVLSCLRHWIELHYYDFDQDPQLLKMLKDFLLKIEDSKYKYSKMWSKNVREALNRKRGANKIWAALMTEFLFQNLQLWYKAVGTLTYVDFFAYYLEKMVVESENLDERVSVVNRILEIMCVFQELNNFNGLFEIYSALVSAAVDRLWFTWE